MNNEDTKKILLIANSLAEDDLHQGIIFDKLSQINLVFLSEQDFCSSLEHVLNSRIV